ncbi:MAG: N-acetylglucosamine kinase [Acetanaerobacterium sp.]
MYYVGVDSGGTKAVFVLTDESGRIIAQHNREGATFLRDGLDGVYKLVRTGVEQLCRQGEIAVEDIASAGLGFPGYGEGVGSKAAVEEACEAAIGKGKAVCCCDSHLGWAGSLAMEPGINIVSGTGSICYGVSADGRSARSSGWGAYGDEGSCTWIGGRLIAAYQKQADGRMPRTRLYEMFRRYYSIEDDILFIQRLNHELSGARPETAKLQVLLKEIWETGDLVADEIYTEAASELALSIHTVARLLGFAGTYNASYSGGLFRSGDCILQPLSRAVEKNGGCLRTPRYAPEVGAILMAMRRIDPEVDFSNLVFFK